MDMVHVGKITLKLFPYTKAAQDVKTSVSKRCCTVMEKKLKNPSCLCAITFSCPAKNAGVKPEAAVTLPKGCNIAVRPVGQHCGDYTALSVMTQVMVPAVVCLLVEVLFFIASSSS